MRLEHHLVAGYVRYISPHIIIISAYTNLAECTHYALLSIPQAPSVFALTKIKEYNAYSAVKRMQSVSYLLFTQNQHIANFFFKSARYAKDGSYTDSLCKKCKIAYSISLNKYFRICEHTFFSLVL